MFPAICHKKGALLRVSSYPSQERFSYNSIRDISHKRDFSSFYCSIFFLPLHCCLFGHLLSLIASLNIPQVRDFFCRKGNLIFSLVSSGAAVTPAGRGKKVADRAAPTSGQIWSISVWRLWDRWAKQRNWFLFQVFLVISRKKPCVFKFCQFVALERFPSKKEKSPPVVMVIVALKMVICIDRRPLKKRRAFPPFESLNFDLCRR